MDSKKIFFFLFLLVLLAPTSELMAAVFDVANVTEFQLALDAAEGNNEDDTINVAAGTYNVTATLTYEPSATENYSLLLEGAGSSSTTFEGGGTIQLIRIDTSALPDDSNAHITIRGINFQNGFSASNGGGLYVSTSSASITIELSSFYSNSAGGSGGGVYVSSVAGSDGGEIILYNNDFHNNSAALYGGGVAAEAHSNNLSLANNTIALNSADYGGGVYTNTGSAADGLLYLTNNFIYLNSAASSGSGIYAFSDLEGGVEITNNGIFYNYGASSTLFADLYVTLTNNTIVDNPDGGLVLTSDRNARIFDIYNNIIWGNTSTGDGSDVYIDGDSDDDGYGATINLYNNDYSDIYVSESDTLYEDDNIHTDPLLDSGTIMAPGSPCLDAGTNSAPSIPTTDWEGDARIIDGDGDGTATVDMGADEYKIPPPTNDDFDSATIIDTVPYSDGLDTSYATGAPDDPSLGGCGAGSFPNTVWYSYTPAADGMLIAQIDGMSKILSVWTGTRGSLNRVGCASSFDKTVLAPVASGTTYYLEVAGSDFAPTATLYVQLQDTALLPALSDAVDNSSLDIYTGIPAPWIDQTSDYFFDGDAAQNGSVSGGEVSWMQTSITGPGILSFYWKVNSTFAATELKFTIDGVRLKDWANTNWTRQQYTLSSGTHSLIWYYQPFSAGYAGRLDQVEFIPGTAIKVISPEGATWKIRDAHPIEWNATAGTGTNVMIELYKDGSLHHIISAETPNDGYYYWWVPAGLEPDNDYSVKITSLADSGIYDFSDGIFEISMCISGPCDGGFMQLTSGSGAETGDQSELSLGGNDGGSFTIEFWYFEQNASPGCPTGLICDIYNAYPVAKFGSYWLQLWRQEEWSNNLRIVYGCIGMQGLQISGDPWGGVSCSESNWGEEWPGGWHHVAGVYDKSTNQIRYYLDGELFSDPIAGPPDIGNSLEPLTIGNGLSGAIDEIRISDIARYPGSNYLDPFTCDENTRALWHADRPLNSTIFHDVCGEDNILIGQGFTRVNGILQNRPPDFDYDFDGWQDPVIFRPVEGRWYILSSGSPGTYSSIVWGAPTDIIAHGDYDGDGKSDAAVWRPETGIWYILPSSNPGTFTATQWGMDGDIPIPGDYDADHVTDIAVWRPDNGIWYVLPSNSPGTYIGVQWGMATDVPTPGDFDADGKIDITVWRPDNGIWYVLPSNSPGTYIGIQWGMATDVPTPGDFDADGKTDIAVWRKNEGMWYVLPSASPGSYTCTQWGLSSDTPVSGDYDGDGKTDIAVWRESNGVWYILPSDSPGSYTAIQWGMMGDESISSLTGILNSIP